MRYYKNIDENGFVCINTLNGDGYGNITQQEYNYIITLLRAMPTGKCLHDDGNGEYSYVDIPVIEDEPTIEEVIEILLGGEM